MVAAVFMTALPDSSHSRDCTMRRRVGTRLGQAVFQQLAVKIQKIFGRFRVSARLEVLVSVARVRNLAALAFSNRRI